MKETIFKDLVQISEALADFFINDISHSDTRVQSDIPGIDLNVDVKVKVFLTLNESLYLDTEGKIKIQIIDIYLGNVLKNRSRYTVKALDEQSATLLTQLQDTIPNSFWNKSKDNKTFEIMCYCFAPPGKIRGEIEKYLRSILFLFE